MGLSLVRSYRSKDMAIPLAMCGFLVAGLGFLGVNILIDSISSLSVTPTTIKPGAVFSLTVRGPRCPGAGFSYVLGLDQALLAPGVFVGRGPQSVAMPFQTAPGRHTLYLYCPDPDSAGTEASGGPLAHTDVQVTD